VQGGTVTPLTSGLFTEDPSWGPLAATAKPGRCANVKRGSKRSERLDGTSFGDRLVGLGGADRLFGLGGADCLAGGDGNDQIDGGKGNDTLDGGAGRDTLLGSSGRDVMRGGSGDDVLRARDGVRDTVDCGSGRKDRASVDKKDRVRRCEKVKRR
jgi:Ca2+-binding RTX toxin-like protein